MSSSSTNKQPLLIDRPICRVESLAATQCLPGSVDPGAGSAGVMLVDCTNNDGALITQIQLVRRHASTAAAVNLYLSRNTQALGLLVTGSSAHAMFVGRVEQPAGAKLGEAAEMELPRLLSPVPHAGANDSAGRPPQYRGLYIEQGFALWAANECSAPDPNAPNILVQGGFF